jgi:hypothetical protein
MRTFREPGLAKAYEQHLTGNGPSMIGDCVPLTPYKKPEYRDLTPAEPLHRRDGFEFVREWLRTRGWCAT